MRHAPRWLSIISYPTRAHRIIVKWTTWLLTRSGVDDFEKIYILQAYFYQKKSMRTTTAEKDACLVSQKKHVTWRKTTTIHTHVPRKKILLHERVTKPVVNRFYIFRRLRLVMEFPALSPHNMVSLQGLTHSSRQSAIGYRLKPVSTCCLLIYEMDTENSQFM